MYYFLNILYNISYFVYTIFSLLLQRRWFTRRAPTESNQQQSESGHSTTSTICSLMWSTNIGTHTDIYYIYNTDRAHLVHKLYIYMQIFNDSFITIYAWRRQHIYLYMRLYTIIICSITWVENITYCHTQTCARNWLVYYYICQILKYIHMYT